MTKSATRVAFLQLPLPLVRLETEIAGRIIELVRADSLRVFLREHVELGMPRLGDPADDLRDTWNLATLSFRDPSSPRPRRLSAEHVFENVSTTALIVAPSWKECVDAACSLQVSIDALGHEIWAPIADGFIGQAESLADVSARALVQFFDTADRYTEWGEGPRLLRDDHRFLEWNRLARRAARRFRGFKRRQEILHLRPFGPRTVRDLTFPERHLDRLGQLALGAVRSWRSSSAISEALNLYWDQLSESDPRHRLLRLVQAAERILLADKPEFEPPPPAPKYRLGINFKNRATYLLRDGEAAEALWKARNALAHGNILRADLRQVHRLIPVALRLARKVLASAIETTRLQKALEAQDVAVIQRELRLLCGAPRSARRPARAAG